MRYLLACAALVSCNPPSLRGRACDRDADCASQQLACVAGACGVAVVDAPDAGAPDAGAPDAGDAGSDAGVDGGVPSVPRTCADVLALHPGAPSGPYALDLDGDGALDDRDGDGAVTDVDDGLYCQMTIGGGGAVLVGFLTSTSVPTDGCPPGWLVEDRRPSFIGCRRGDIGGAGGGQAAVFIGHYYPYRTIIGVVEAVPYGAGNAFTDLPQFSDGSIDSPYVDGVSITVGDPRVHVFTFASADKPSVCPCAGGPAAPAFVGGDYVCDEPTAALVDGGPVFDPGDPQWDGSDNTCEPVGFAATAPFFVVDTGAVRDDPIEVRIMSDESGAVEDFAITRLELYVR